VWLLEEHRARWGEYPFAQLYAWACDQYQERARLAVGVFGQRRPLLVVPVVEGRGSGIGLWPVIVPRDALSALWPVASRPQ
jgi:hypothetical protein